MFQKILTIFFRPCSRSRESILFQGHITIILKIETLIDFTKPPAAQHLESLESLLIPNSRPT